MTTGPIGPGTVLAGRYRLDDLLAESDGARFWRATDTILARSVAIHALHSDDARAPGLLEAARLSATVVDPHLLRVLDCEEDDGITWVVNEWGDGISLDLMLQQGTLPPSRAAWLTREVAEAIAAGHAQGVAHGRLNPEAVLVTHAGSVKLIGYVVDASLMRPRPPDPLYGELDHRESDVINLAGILYAALTGRWPGVAPSSVPAAPREGRRPLRPRQVRAGVPRTLDVICDRVLHKEGSLHALPIETAHEIAAALADYVGDPSLTAPVDAAAIHSEPPPVLGPDPFPETSDPADPAAPETADPGADPEATQVAVPVAGAGSRPTPAPDPDPTVAVDPEATAFHQFTSPDPETVTVRQPAAPPPPFPETPERPLFADTERRVPASAPGTGATSWGWADPPDGPVGSAGPGGSGGAARLAENGHPAGPGGGGATGFWPFDADPEDEPEHHTGKEGRGWLRTAIAVAVLLLLVIAVAVTINRNRPDGATPADDAGASRSPANAGQPLEIAAVEDFDPESDDPQENPEEAPNAVDGDPATSWRTSTYFNNPALGGLKSGVGLRLDLGEVTRVGSVTVRFTGSPTSFEVYAAPPGADAAPESLDGLEKVATEDAAPARATVPLDPTPRTRYLVVWLTELPAVPDGFRGEVTEITARS